MSLTFIDDFQRKLYNLLSNDKAIMSSVKKIYLGAVQDGKPPFLLINIDSVNDLSRRLDSVYSIKFRISAYAQDNNHGSLINLSDKIINCVLNSKNRFDHYIIIGIKANSFRFEKAKDLVLNKLTINYKTLIKKRIK